MGPETIDPQVELNYVPVNQSDHCIRKYEDLGLVFHQAHKLARASSLSLLDRENRLMPVSRSDDVHNFQKIFRGRIRLVHGFDVESLADNH